MEGEDETTVVDFRGSLTGGARLGIAGGVLEVFIITDDSFISPPALMVLGCFGPEDLASLAREASASEEEELLSPL